MAMTVTALRFVRLRPASWPDLSHVAPSHVPGAHGAHSDVILFRCAMRSPNFKIAKFYTEPFQAISPNLMAAKISRYTVVSKSDVAKSDVAKSDVGISDVAKSDVAKSDVAKSDVAKSLNRMLPNRM